MLHQINAKCREFKVTLGYENCDAPLCPENVEIVFERLGSAGAKVHYQAATVEGNEAWFKWGSAILSQRPGRYGGTIYVNGCECGWQEFNVGDKCKVTDAVVIESLDACVSATTCEPGCPPPIQSNACGCQTTPCGCRSGMSEFTGMDLLHGACHNC